MQIFTFFSILPVNPAASSKEWVPAELKNNQKPGSL